MSEEAASSTEASEASRGHSLDSNNNLELVNCQCYLSLDPYPSQHQWRTNPSLQHYCRVCNTQLNSCRQVGIHVGGKKHEKRFNFLKFSIESGAGNPSDELQQYQDAVNLSNNFASLNLSQGQQVAAGILNPTTPEAYPVPKVAAVAAPAPPYTYQTGYTPPAPATTNTAYYPAPVQQQQQQVPSPYTPAPYQTQAQAYYQPAQAEYYPQPAETSFYGYQEQPQQQPYPYAPAYQQPYYPVDGGVADSKSTETGSVMSTVSHNSKININAGTVDPTTVHNYLHQGDNTRNIVPTSQFTYPPPRVGGGPGGPPPDLLMCTPAVQPAPYPLKKDIRRTNNNQGAGKKSSPRLPLRDGGDGGSQGTGGADSAHSGKMGESESGTSSASGEIRCEVCQVSVNSSHQLQAHLAGHKHRQRCFRRGIDPVHSMMTPFSSSSPSRTPSESSCPPTSLSPKVSPGKLVPHGSFFRTSLLGHPSLEPIRDIQTSLMGNPPVLANLTFQVNCTKSNSITSKKSGSNKSDSSKRKTTTKSANSKENAEKIKASNGKVNQGTEKGTIRRSLAKKQESKRDELKAESASSSTLLDMFLQTLEPHHKFFENSENGQAESDEVVEATEANNNNNNNAAQVAEVVQSR